MTPDELSKFLSNLDLGNSAPYLWEDSCPVKVDDEKIRKLFRNELSGEDRAEILALVSTYKDWHAASIRVMREQGEQEVVKRQLFSAILFQFLFATRMRRLVAVASAALILGGFFFWPSSSNSFRNGETLIAMRNGQLKDVESFNLHWRDAINSAFTNGTLPANNAQPELQGDLIGLRGGFSEFIKSPYFSVVAGNKPVLQWRTSQEAESYEIYVYSEPVLDTDKPIFEPVRITSANSWQVNTDLAPGLYRWYIIHVSKGGDVQFPQSDEYPARFLVLSADQQRRIADLEQLSADSPLELFLLYTSEGLFDNAQEQLNRLRTDNPGLEALSIIEEQFLKRRSAVLEK